MPGPGADIDYWERNNEREEGPTHDPLSDSGEDDPFFVPSGGGDEAPVRGIDYTVDEETGEIIWRETKEREEGPIHDPLSDAPDPVEEEEEEPILPLPGTEGTTGLGGTRTNRNPLLNRPPANGVSNTTRKGLMTT